MGGRTHEAGAQVLAEGSADAGRLHTLTWREVRVRVAGDASAGYSACMRAPSIRPAIAPIALVALLVTDVSRHEDSSSESEAAIGASEHVSDAPHLHVEAPSPDLRPDDSEQRPPFALEEESGTNGALVASQSWANQSAQQWTIAARAMNSDTCVETLPSWTS